MPSGEGGGLHGKATITTTVLIPNSNQFITTISKMQVRENIKNSYLQKFMFQNMNHFSKCNWAYEYVNFKKYYYMFQVTDNFNYVIHT